MYPTCAGVYVRGVLIYVNFADPPNSPLRSRGQGGLIKPNYIPPIRTLRSRVLTAPPLQPH